MGKAGVGETGWGNETENFDKRPMAARTGKTIFIRKSVSFGNREFRGGA